MRAMMARGASSAIYPWVAIDLGKANTVIPPSPNPTPPLGLFEIQIHTGVLAGCARRSGGYLRWGYGASSVMVASKAARLVVHGGGWLGFGRAHL